MASYSPSSFSLSKPTLSPFPYKPADKNDPPSRAVVADEIMQKIKEKAKEFKFFDCLVLVPPKITLHQQSVERFAEEIRVWLNVPDEVSLDRARRCVLKTNFGKENERHLNEFEGRRKFVVNF